MMTGPSRIADSDFSLQEVYIMQQCSFDRNIVQFYGAPMT